MIELSKLKPFNLVEAKQGKPICTRDGRKARIICWNLKDNNYPIVAAVENGDKEDVFKYTRKGYYFCSGKKDTNDLKMIPEERKGFINIYKSSTYATKEEAMKRSNKIEDYIDTIEITWYE